MSAQTFAQDCVVCGCKNYYGDITAMLFNVVSRSITCVLHDSFTRTKATLDKGLNYICCRLHAEDGAARTGIGAGKNLQGLELCRSTHS